MKLSNKILIGFFGVLFVYLTAAFTEVRLSGTPNIISAKNSIAETVDIKGVAHVVLQGAGNKINISGSDKAVLEVRSFSGDFLKNVTYKIAGDTLVLSGFTSDLDKPNKVSVLVPSRALKSITVRKSVVTIANLNQETIMISQDAGRLWMEGSIIDSIDMVVTNRSYSDLTATVVKQLSVAVDNSQLHVHTPVEFVRGTVNNDAFVGLNGIREIQLKKDESSRLNLYQNP